MTGLGLLLQHDTRDDRYDPTTGVRMRAGGDYNFGRREADAAIYGTPLRGRDTPVLNGVTFVDRFLFGWMEQFGASDYVPFFERYYVGGTNTVRGHRTRWLTPRGLEEQCVGGEIELVTNLEARVPIFPQTFNRQLSAAVFFDVGRSYHRFSEIGDFGYGFGGGLRYVAHIWKLTAVLRADYAFSLGHEGDDAVARLHLSFGLPF